MIKISTDRLYITSLSEIELEELVTQYKDTVPDLSNAYAEMLENCRIYPADSVWYAPLKMCLNSSNKAVGYAGFRGPCKNGSVEIGYGLEEEYQGCGYAFEGVKAICKWAFTNDGIIRIEAESEQNNLKSVKLLEKLGFVKTGTFGSEGPRFVLIKNDVL